MARCLSSANLPEPFQEIRMDIIFVWLVFAFLVGLIGSSRKIGFFKAFLAAVFLSPIIGLVIALISPSKRKLLEIELLRKIAYRE